MDDAERKARLMKCPTCPRQTTEQGVRCFVCQSAYEETGPIERKDDLADLWQAIADRTKGDGFWLGEILLTTIERETGFNPSKSAPSARDDRDYDHG